MKIIILIVAALFLVACSDDGSQSSVKKDIVKEAVSVTQSTPEVVEEVKESAIEIAPVAVEVVADENAQVVLEESTEVIVTKSGVDLFKVCSSCHGLNGEKKALNKSQVIQGWSEIQVLTALNGYKDGSYGGAMKGLMKSQVIKLSDEDITALSKYISER